MLTSEDARDQLCPHMRDWEHGDAHGESFIVYEHIPCRGNMCPKWRAAYEFMPDAAPCRHKHMRAAAGEKVMIQGDWLAVEHCREMRNINSCAECEDAYGYCGG